MKVLGKLSLDISCELSSQASNETPLKISIPLKNEKIVNFLMKNKNISRLNYFRENYWKKNQLKKINLLVI